MIEHKTLRHLIRIVADTEERKAFEERFEQVQHDDNIREHQYTDYRIADLWTSSNGRSNYSTRSVVKREYDASTKYKTAVSATYNYHPSSFLAYDVIQQLKAETSALEQQVRGKAVGNLEFIALLDAMEQDKRSTLLHERYRLLDEYLNIKKPTTVEFELLKSQFNDCLHDVNRGLVQNFSFACAMVSGALSFLVDLLMILAFVAFFAALMQICAPAATVALPIACLALVVACVTMPFIAFGATELLTKRILSNKLDIAEVTDIVTSGPDADGVIGKVKFKDCAAVGASDDSHDKSSYFQNPEKTSGSGWFRDRFFTSNEQRLLVACAPAATI